MIRAQFVGGFFVDLVNVVDNETTKLRRLRAKLLALTGKWTANDEV